MMHSGLASCARTVLERACLDRQTEIIEHLVSHRLRSLIGWAAGLIARYHVADRAFAAEDAVQDSLLTLWRAARGGKIDWMATEEQLLKLVRHKLAQEVLHELAREGRSKRGGGRATASCHTRTSSSRHLLRHLHAIDSCAAPVEEQAIAQEELAATLQLVGQDDPSLRAVATKKAEGFTHREIASVLGLPLWSVEQKVRVIKGIVASSGHGLL
jgi:DNA-directed RNA polymerase specialized sigma24 family protein